MLEILEEEAWFYSLERETETDEYFLEVVCGTVAIFTIRIRLSSAELAAYRADPSTVRALAYDVLDHPHEYNERAVR